MTSAHVFDQAMVLQHSDLQSGLFTGEASQHYWNMVGPFGGTTAAVLMRALLQHPDLLGAPIALTVNYAAAITAGAFEVQATPVRTNRSTQHWSLVIRQPDAEGRMQVNTTATAVTALRRPTWSTSDFPKPDVPAPDAVPRLTIGPKGVSWLQHYEMRPVSGAIPTNWDGGGEASESVLWLRDAPARALDFCSLAAMSDLFYPRVWLRRATPVPAGTVSITTYFHAGRAELADCGTAHLLGQARGQHFGKGYFDQTAQLWSESGQLLATSSQIVYYKE